MRFDRLIELLQSEGHSLDTIMFKSLRMEHWYRPIRIGRNGTFMFCTSPTRKDVAEWQWTKASNLRRRSVHSIKVDRDFFGKKLTGLGSIIRVYLKDDV